MACEDLGPELWALIVHLFHKYRHDTSKAISELTLRTHSTWSAEVGAPRPRKARDILQSPWYHKMCSAYASLLDEIRATHKRDIDDAKELVASLYPEGCNVSEFAEAVRTSAAVLPSLIPSELIDHFITAKGLEFHAKDVHEVNGDELASSVVGGLLMTVLIPRRWWCESSDAKARVTRIGIRGTPPSIYIEYEKPARVSRVRYIHLEGHLRVNAPTAQLARRLAVTHEALLSETQFQSLLIRCQRLQNQGPPMLPRVEISAASPPPKSVPAVKSPPMDDLPVDGRAKRSAEVQKADLGLLYRDPEAALKNVDLNEADEVTLHEFKEVMNEKFKANLLRPGDPGYVYDKRVEVAAPVGKSDWDDDSD